VVDGADRTEGRHGQLLAARCIHLLSDNLNSLLEHAQTQRQEYVGSGHLFVDESSADQQLGTTRFLVARGFFAGFDKTG